MDALLLDTNIVSYLMKGHSLAERYRGHLEGRTLAISFMTVGELYEGAYRQSWGEKKIRALDELIRTYLIIPYTPNVCRVWGDIRCQRRSQTIAVDDAWIAATAVAHDCPLVTHNPDDFSKIDGLKVITEHNSGDPGRGPE